MSGIAYAWMAIGALVLGLVAPATGNATTAEDKARSERTGTPRLTFGPRSSSNERR
jgi:hypothetical protein